MALTAAERQARFRAHKAGRHDLCSPDRECRGGQPQRRVRAAPALDESAGPGRGAPLPALEEISPARPRALDRRSARARELWDELAGRLDASGRILLLEACRMADRLDRLDAIVDGNDEWLRVSTEHGDVVVAVDAALAEARQHATALRGLLADLAKLVPKGRTPRSPDGTRPGGGLAGFSTRLAARRGASSG